MKKEVTSLTGEQEAGVENEESYILNEEKQSEEQPADAPIDAPIDEVIDKSAEQIPDKPRKKYKKIFIIIIATICTILSLYFGMAAYFINHFYFASKINGINISGKSVKDVEELMEAELETYTVDLKERGEKMEQIKAYEIGLKYASDNEFKNLKEGQTPFGWFSACFNTKDSKMTVGVVYDEKLLEKRINNLSCFNSRYIIEPKNPSFKYVDNNYVIVNEIPGNKVDKDMLNAHVSQALLNREAEIDLELLKSYINPQYTAKSQKIIDVKDTLNKYASSKIIYTFENSKEIIDGSKINKWLRVDKNLRIIVNKEKIKDYIGIILEKHNTIRGATNFATSSGKNIQISGGDFVCSIDKVKETKSLVLAIEEGRTLTKDFIYGDIGNTYVEIDLTNQHLCFYKNNVLVVEGDVVTGDVSRNRVTPEGIYILKHKAKNAVLRGPGYAAPVAFWMPFNKGIGIHDATWRNGFGGNIYTTNGSHGCINCPYKLVKGIYNDIEVGTPVICY